MSLVILIPVLLLLIIALGIVYWLVLRLLCALPERAHETHAVTTDDGWTLRLYRFRPQGEPGEPILLIHGTSANYVTWAYPEGAAAVDALTAAGYDCWLLDLRACRSAIPPIGQSHKDVTMDDYLTKDIPAVIAFVLNETGQPRLHWVGHSLGGMLLYAYQLAGDATRIASGITLGAPPGFRHVVPKFNRLEIGMTQLSPTLVRTAARCMAPFFVPLRLRSKLLPINWANVHPRVGVSFFFNLIEATPPKVAADMTFWVNNRGWRVCKDSVDVDAGLMRLSAPLLAVYGINDPLISMETARRFFDGIAQPDKKMLVLSKANGHAADYNHIELPFSREGENEVFQPIIQWLRAHPVSAAAARGRTAPRAKSSGPRSTESKPRPRRRTAGRTTAKTGAKRKRVSKRTTQPVAAKRSSAQGKKKGGSGTKTEGSTPKSPTKKKPASRKPAAEGKANPKAKKIAVKKGAPRRPAQKKKADAARKDAAGKTIGSSKSKRTSKKTPAKSPKRKPKSK